MGRAFRWGLLVVALGIGLIAGLGQAAEGCVDYTPQRTTGIGGWLLFEDLGVAFRVWTSEKGGLEFSIFAPSSGGRLWTQGKSLFRILDTCYLDGYFALGALVPVGGSFDWQRANLSVGLEFGLPDIPELAFEIEIGISIWHYYSYWAWHWATQGFSGLGFQFYF